MLLTDLLNLDGPSGDEKPVRDRLREEALKYTDEVEVDALGNLYAIKRGKKSDGSPVMLCAHMDEIGFIVRGIREDGLVAYSPIGSVDPRVLPGKLVRLGAKRVTGVIGYKAVHLVSADEEKQAPKHEGL